MPLLTDGAVAGAVMSSADAAYKSAAPDMKSSSANGFINCARGVKGRAKRVSPGKPRTNRIRGVAVFGVERLLLRRQPVGLLLLLALHSNVILALALWQR